MAQDMNSPHPRLHTQVPAVTGAPVPWPKDSTSTQYPSSCTLGSAWPSLAQLRTGRNVHTPCSAPRGLHRNLDPPWASPQWWSFSVLCVRCPSSPGTRTAMCLRWCPSLLPKCPSLLLAKSYYSVPEPKPLGVGERRRWQLLGEQMDEALGPTGSHEPPLSSTRESLLLPTSQVVSSLSEAPKAAGSKQFASSDAPSYLHLSFSFPPLDKTDKIFKTFLGHS